MSMLTRTGTIMRKDRRRSITKYSRERRGSAPVILTQNYMGCAGGKVGLTRTAALRLDRDLKRLAQVASPARCVKLNTDLTWFNEDFKDDIDPTELIRAYNVTPIIHEHEHSSMGDLRDIASTLDEEDSPPVQILQTRAHNTQKPLTYGTPSRTEARRCYDDLPISLIASLQEANVESVSAWHFVRKAFSNLTSTLGFTVLLSLLLIVPVAMISVGATYLNECPVEPKIPIYLLVGGCFGLTKILMSLWLQLRIKKHGIVSGSSTSYDDRSMSAMYGMTEVGISLFLCIWFILGNVWVLSNWQPHYTLIIQEPRNWCASTVYLFAFWKLVACYIVFLLIAILAGMFVLCHLCMVYLRDRDTEVEL